MPRIPDPVLGDPVSAEWRKWVTKEILSGTSAAQRQIRQQASVANKTITATTSDVIRKTQQLDALPTQRIKTYPDGSRSLVISGEIPDMGDIELVTLTSDAFESGSGDLIGRTSDAAFGGSPMEWVGSDIGIFPNKAFIVEDGAIRTRDTANRDFAGFHITAMNVEISCTIVQIAPNRELRLELRRSDVEITVGTAYSLRAEHTSDGTGELLLFKKYGNTYVGIGSRVPFSFGDSVTFRAHGDSLSAYVNGELKISRSDSDFNVANYVGVYGEGGAGTVIDGVVVREVLDPTP